MMTLGGFVFGRSARDLSPWQVKNQLNSIFFILNPCKFQIIIVSLHPEHLNNDDYDNNHTETGNRHLLEPD